MKTNPIRLIPIVRVAWTAGWDLAIAGAFLITWIAPETFGERMVHQLAFLMIIEFLVVHATGFFTAFGATTESSLKRAGMTAGLLAFYTLFAGAFSLAYGSPWPLFLFFLVILPRIPTLVFQPRGPSGQFVMMAHWAGMTALYIFGVFATIILPVPALGITPEVIEAQEFGMTGLWPEEPYRVVAFGVIYFTGQALLALGMEAMHTRFAANLED